MTKEELLVALKENAENVKKAEDTVANIETKEVKAPIEKADGVTGLDSELPTQKEVEKEVAAAVDPLVPACEKTGESKNGGESDKMEPGKVEAERKKEDNAAKDVINVSTRKVEESAEVNEELLKQLREAAEREEAYKEKIANITSLCEEALKKQEAELTKGHASEMHRVFEAVIAEGEKMEKELTEAAAKNEKMYKAAHKLYESSSKLNKILLEAVKAGRSEKTLSRYSTVAYRATASLRK